MICALILLYSLGVFLAFRMNSLYTTHTITALAKTISQALPRIQSSSMLVLDLTTHVLLPSSETVPGGQRAGVVVPCGQ